MRKSRKICCRITPGRVVGAVLLAASAVNLIIVGAAFEFSFSEVIPSDTATSTTLTVTLTPFPPTVTGTNTSTFTMTPSDTPTPTPTFTSTMTATFTSTSTNTATPTDTPSISPTQCIPRYDWPIYIVQRGDTLSSLAVATGSSVEELMQANCLTSTLIRIGQKMYVPRLPLIPTAVPPTATDTPITPSITPTSTVSPPTYTPTYTPEPPVITAN